ncbi:hypothetical protein BK643_26155 [Pseudomonas protegens]|uniref:T6SS phospholipase effector Tle1-like catalytic domain-containing protein n=1 Tax=Pseudomonas protegens TaxID=380021 RepID=UPI000F47E844|nr:DUF2235 domain-containing protein [Pseudomonas protegens]ROM13068.1 hypothetical protein BK643_26155 [Pseudomonas protegens]
MPEALTPPHSRPEAQWLTPTPEFRDGGLLPETPKQVAHNRREQHKAFAPFELAAQRAAQAAGNVYIGSPCMKILSITLYFDGTNNHEPSDSIARPSTTTNVARLYHASLGRTSKESIEQQGFYAYYMQGVGTEFKEIGEFKPDADGLKMSMGGEKRINWGLTRLIDALKRACGKEPLTVEDSCQLVEKMGTSLTEDLLGASLFKDSHARRQEALKEPLATLKSEIDAAHAAKSIARIKAVRLFIYGFSRGAAEARAFATWLEALTRVEVNGETCYLFAGLPIKIVFMGLFDTVASVGIPYIVPFAAGHMGWADGSLRLPDSEAFLEHCVHLVAAHEQRGCFPLDSIRRKADPDDPDCPSTYRNGTAEYLYPGMHSDVGGGYPPGDQGKAFAGSHELLSQIALHHMYAEAFKVGAPLQVPSRALGVWKKEWPWLEMDVETENEFDIGPTPIKRFNTWLKSVENGPLEDVMERQAGLITGWRINRYANYRLRHTPSYGEVMKSGHPRGGDMTAREIESFEALHRMQLEEDAAVRANQPLPEWSERQQQTRQEHERVKQEYERRTGAASPVELNTSKVFEPSLDHRQLENAMTDFRRDYIPEWGLSEGDGFSLGSLPNILLGGIVYMTNDQDEAEDYAKLRRAGNHHYAMLFDSNGQPLDEQAKAIIRLFDEQVHDSRAWFMNSNLNERELFSDYFRYRCVFFDNESNKQLSLLATATRVIGVAVAVGSIGLSIKRRDPRLLVGLIIPSLGIPVLRGKAGLPEIRAFDTVTGLALPMLEGMEALRVFTHDPGSVLKQAQALPMPAALNEQTATTDDLKTILKAAQALAAQANAPNAAPEEPLNPLDAAQEATVPGWLDQAKSAARHLNT